jgi:ferritin-like metal-binding protein YciE
MPRELNARDAKLVQWLQEAHAKETELVRDLQAHITLTEKQAYKKRLQKHLIETRAHKRQVASRVKKLGGALTDGPVPEAVSAAAGTAVAAVKGQLGAARAMLTEQAETHLRNAQEELREEHVEIAIYARIEAFARAVGDSETAKLAAAIRRDEERMAKYLSAELERLVRDVVRAEVPRDQRPSPRRSRTRSTSRKRSTSGAARSGSSRSRRA